MTKSRLLSKPSGVVSAAVVATMAAVASAKPNPKVDLPKTLRLYVFDCGVIQGMDVGRFNFKKEELAETRMAVPCYLVAHPKGTLMWDVGAIQDTAFKDDGAPVTQGNLPSTKSLNL